jgi:uncharacterized protein YidB (DUF937 family)
MKMAKSNTMLKALLGLAVVAGWQNRDKIGDFVKGVTGGGSAATGADAPAGGLGGLVDAFKKAGLGDKADSWVASGPNAPVTAPEVEKGLGGDVLDGLAEQTGLSREELLKRLSAVLPEMVDKMTPSGKL